jgi:hypothetical protein
VSHDQLAIPHQTSDPDVENFLILAQSGRDRAASMLNELQEGISNGGLYSTIENLGVEFLVECLEVLREIGAKDTVRILEEAVEVWRDHQSVLSEYTALPNKLGKLDVSFCSLKESIASLYVRTNKNT